MELLAILVSGLQRLNTITKSPGTDTAAVPITTPSCIVYKNLKSKVFVCELQNSSSKKKLLYTIIQKLDEV